MKTTTPPPLQVLTDADLLKRITAFQIGIPWPLYEFWLQHKGDYGKSVVAAFRDSAPVVSKIVECGSLKLLELATRVHVPTKSSFFYRASPLLTLNLHATARFAIQFNRPEALEWGLTYNREHEEPNRHQRGRVPQAKLWELVLGASRDDDMRMLDVLKRHLPTDQKSLQDIFPPFFAGSNVETVAQLRWFVTELPELRVETMLLTSAAERGDLEMVGYLFELGGCGRCEANTASKLYRRRSERDWDVVAFMLEHDLVDVRDDAARAMIEDKDEFIQRLVRKCAPLFQTAFEEVVRESVEWGDPARPFALLGNDCFNTNFPISIDRAAADGRLEIIKMLHDRGLATATTDAMDRAAETRHWDVVKFLHENRSEGCTTRAMDAAADQGYFEHVKFLWENRTEGCSPRAMNEAAKQRDMEILRYLHEHTNATCTTDAMDGAAAEGHLHVVKFLHKNRSEGCTVAAMNEAAARGHLNVVQFLHENRTEGCTIDAVNGAIRYRKSQLITFLREHYPHFFDHELLHDALLYGAFDLYMDLSREFPEQAHAVVGEVAYEAGKEVELPTIRFIADVLQRSDVVYRAMDGAAGGRRCAQGEWLRAVFAAAGPQSCRLSAVEAITTNDRRGFRQGANTDTIAFVLNACCEEGARDVVLEAARRTQNQTIQAALAVEPSGEPRPLHPFLLDPRTPSWAVHIALDCHPVWYDPYWRHRGQFAWALRAVYANDLTLLEVLRDTPAYVRPHHDCHGREIDTTERFSFAGARAAATRTGNLPILQWLFEHVDLPVEPALLTEAVYYHKFDVALWLVEHHPEACAETNWGSMTYVPWLSSCGLNDELFDWLEAHESVRSVLDLGKIIDATARLGDDLRMLYKRYPELVMARPNLMELASKHDDNDDASDAVAFLWEIGYRDREQSKEVE